VTGDGLATALLLFVSGFWWGEWWASRRALKIIAVRDPAFQLLYGMVSGIIEKRKLVGRYLTIYRQERFEISGEKFSLTLQSDGDPTAVIDAERVS
jgi:hypothetical protein